LSASSEPIDRARLLSGRLVASLEYHKVLESTNDRAKTLAREGGIELPALILAGRQTAGRGRGRNRWWSGPESLAFTLLVNTEPWKTAREQISLSALAAGIAVVEAVSRRVAQHAVGLHWPNDVYVGDRKLSGILVEVPVENRLVVGIGINTNCRLDDAPPELRQRITALIELTGDVHDHTGLVADWLVAWTNWIGRLPDRPGEIGERANGLCLQCGRVLRLRQGSQVYEGECLGIASDGAIRLRGKEGVREFYSGSVE